LTPGQLALLGVTVDAPRGDEPQEVAQKMAQDRYWQHVALRDSLPHVTGARRHPALHWVPAGSQRFRKLQHF